MSSFPNPAKIEGLHFVGNLGRLSQMKSCLPWALALLVLVPGLPAADDRAEVVTPATLIEDLGSESYPVRVRASYALWEMGAEVEDLLAEAAGSEDPETSLRAEELLRKIQLGILPDSPEEVVALVTRYDLAKPSERVKIIRDLKRLRAWRQVLKMHALERDPETLRRIGPEMAGVSTMAARDALVGEEPDFDEARSLLELGRPEPGQLMALADFHRVRGTLADELKKAAKLQGQPGSLWRYILHSAAGNRKEARQEAEALGDELAVARLKLLDGDPLDWIARAPVPSGEIPPTSLSAYRRAAKGIWNDRDVPEGFTKELVSSIRSNFDDESWLSLGVLYAIGEPRRADSLLAQLSPPTAFLILDSAERVDEALEVLDLDPRDPDYRGWVKERFETIQERPDRSEDALLEVAQIGGFLERRGLHHELHEAFVGPLVELSKADPEWFIEVASELGSGYSSISIFRPVLAACAEFAKNDGQRWELVRKRIFGDSDHIEGLWESVTKFDPELSHAERLTLMARLFGRLPADGSEDKWWAWEMGRLDPGQKREHAERLGLLLSVSALASLAERFVTVADLVREADLTLEDLGPYSNEFRFASYEIFCLGSVGRWNDVADRWRVLVDRDPTRPMNQAYLAGALRLAGREDEAVVHDEMAERLALGDPGTMVSIGQAYASSVDFERAMEWWMRAATQSVEIDQNFYAAALLSAEESKQRGEWKLAASLGEMSLLYMVMKGEVSKQPNLFSRGRLEITMARAFSRIEDHRELAVKALTRCHADGPTDGSMADFFFPGLREVGLTDLHDQWFEETWVFLEQVLEKYPKSHNTMNSAAWTAARANRRLEEARGLLEKALQMKPNQAAYLDTMGEIHFAKGDREEALRWSQRGVKSEPGDETLLRQFERFQNGPFPLD